MTIMPRFVAEPTVEPSRVRHLPEFCELAPLVAEPGVTDVFVSGSAGVWVDCGDGAKHLPEVSLTEQRARQLAISLVSLGGRHIDEATPCVDVRLKDGIRVHAVLPPVSCNGTTISIRVPRLERMLLSDLNECGFFQAGQLVQIQRLVRERKNVLISGATGSGKTTLLSAMLSAAAIEDRIIAIEDVAELRVQHPHFLSLEARQSNLEGVGEIGLARLVREALRMRPSRLVLGECRGVEVRELFAALNTGHSGGAGTLHANSILDVPARLEALGSLAGLSPQAVARQAASAIDSILHLGWLGGKRALLEIGEFELNATGLLQIRSKLEKS
ncbi:MAG: TadA family conjugal transfer-associated ATPase [Microbacteriaceae bacterium]|nr:TadA family conjugal transfer-associated ATPase [Microbacteriaceae bacterium]